MIATSVSIFSLLSCFTGVYAWFSINQSVSVEGASFKVVVPDQLEYELYYLNTFEDGEGNTKYGNWNPTIGYFSGYQVDYADALFTEVVFDEGEVTNDPDPTNIDHLWPAHKLTFAFVITQSNMNKLSLTSWTESDGTAKTSISQLVRLSWAIDIYGVAYSVLDSGNNLNDVNSAYATYYAASKTDVFNYSETNLAPNPVEPVDIVTSVPTNTENYRTIVYFTIEFSNNNSTFYSLNESTGFYVKDSVTGNSNCYEGLSLTNLEFTIS